MVSCVVHDLGINESETKTVTQAATSSQVGSIIKRESKRTKRSDSESTICEDLIVAAN